jgi:hypothetical protein
MRAWLLSPFAFLAAAALAQPGAAPDPEVAALLAGMRAACGGDAWDRVEGWHETGRVDLPGGISLPYEAWHSMHNPPTALYVNRVDGRIVRQSGYDGAARWQAGPNGQVRSETDPEALRRARRDAWLSNFGWLLPSRLPARFELLGSRDHDGHSYDVLRATPEGGDSAELWIDRDTSRVARLVAGAEQAELSDYRDFAGVCTATLGRQGDGDPAHAIVLHVESVETGPVDPARFAPPAPAGQ